MSCNCGRSRLEGITVWSIWTPVEITGRFSMYKKCSRNFRVHGWFGIFILTPASHSSENLVKRCSPHALHVLLSHFIILEQQGDTVPPATADDIQPDRVAVPDPIWNTPQGWAGRAQEEGHSQNWSRKQVNQGCVSPGNLKSAAPCSC